MKFVWTKQLSVGNRIIDTQHKRLHNTINELSMSIAACNVVALTGIFDLLEDYMRDCFIAEENIARAIGFDFSQHKLTHQHLLEEFSRIRAELMVKNGAWSKDEAKHYAKALMSSLVKHIEVDGKPFRTVLDTHFYDLKPNGVHGAPQ